MKEMVSEAEQLGTNSVIGVCFSTASVTSGAAEVIVCGTAVYSL